VLADSASRSVNIVREIVRESGATRREYGIMLLDTGTTKDAARKSQAVALLRTAIRLDGLPAEPYYRPGNLALTEERQGLAESG
jgi:hypothetical protein